MICEICKKDKPDTRFEGWAESFICDICLLEQKRKSAEQDKE